jgi:hypothetical protein
LLIGHFFGRLSAAAAVALLLAPLLCWVTELPLLRQRRSSIVAALRLALVATPLIVVLVLAKRDFDRNTRPLLVPVFPESEAPVESAPSPSGDRNH